MRILENFEMYTSDKIRIEIIRNFINNLNNYEKVAVNLDNLLDDFDGYDNQTFLDYNSENDTINFYEGWTRTCWDGAYSKPEYKNKSKKEIIEDVINRRFVRIAKELNLEIVDTEYWYHKPIKKFTAPGYIMKIAFKLRKS